MLFKYPPPLDKSQKIDRGGEFKPNRTEFKLVHSAHEAKYEDDKKNSTKTQLSSRVVELLVFIWISYSF